MLARPRLVELAARRWCHRVVTIVAGPGFGKSVLVAQATAENRLAPQGVEHTLSCTAADSSPAHFLGRVAAVVDPGGRSRTATPPDHLAKELGRRWPMGVCLMIDDVHHLTASSEGARMLARLVTDAPAPVHFLLTGRRPIRGLGRLRAAGDVVDIVESDLELSAEELTALAHAHGTDPSTIAAVGRWPAAATVAARYGISGATEYVWDTVIDQLDEPERRVLAVASAIGRSDRHLLRAAVAGIHADPSSVLECVPLVHSPATDEFVVHDLWHPLVADAISDVERRAAVQRTVDVHLHRLDYDRAFDLCAAYDLWELAAHVVISCCSRGHAFVGPQILAGWLDALPAQREEEPEGLLLRGLVGRVTDPFGEATASLLQQAAERFRALGNVTGEVAAFTELAYVWRNQGRCEALPVLLARANELHAAGHHEVDGLVALGRGLMAEFVGDDERLVDELESVPPGSLSRDWQAVVAFRLATGHLTLGNEHPMLEAAYRCVELAGTGTARHVAALAEWFAGDPRPALAACDSIVADALRSRVDALALGSFATMVLATSGQVDAAAHRLASTERVATGPVAALMSGYLVGIRSLVAASRGDDAEARDHVEKAIADAPLSSAIGWQMATRWLPLAYVLCPSVRADIDARQLGALHQRRLAVARAVVAAREGGRLDPASLAAIQPRLVTTTVPLPWAMQLAGRLEFEQCGLARVLGETLFDLFGRPAKDALRDATGHGDKRIAVGARRLLATLPIAPAGDLCLDVLGPAALHVDGTARADIEWQRGRVRSLLLFLVVNGPASREQITDALWPDLDMNAADRNLRVTLTYLQRLLEPERRKGEAPFFVRQHGSTLAVVGAPHVRVDAHVFDALVERADEADRRGTPSVAADLFERAVGLWRGRCLADVADEEWAQGMCRELTARFVRSAVRAGELNLAAGRTDTARRLARRALGADEWSEPAHRVLIAAALADGDRGGAARALAECTAALEDLGVAVGPETAMLRRRLHAPGPVLELSA